MAKTETSYGSDIKFSNIIQSVSTVINTLSNQALDLALDEGM